MQQSTEFENKILLSQNCPVIWLVGLSGSGKTTLAVQLGKYLKELGLAVFLLDGDELRNGLNKNLGFSEADRYENLRRAAELAKLFQKAGIVTIASFISPTNELRKMIAGNIPNDFYEIYIKCSLETCEQRDVKGLYKKARAGEIPNFTGISAPFEVPVNPHFTIDTEKCSIENSCKELIHLLQDKGIIKHSYLQAHSQA